MFDVFYIGDNINIEENVPFARKVEDETQINARTKMYWLIEPNVELMDYDVLEYRPPAYDQKYTHIWKWDSRNYGGIKLLPKKKSEGIKEINKVVCKKRFDVLPTATPGDYFASHSFATHVWCVDPEYKLNDNIDWAPDNFEPNFIHSFHLRNQLEHKYPEQEGGIKLFPRDWKTSSVKYHKFLDAAKQYPVMYVADVDDYAQRDVYDEEYVWLIDAEHRVSTDTLDWVPNPFESNMVHCFRMPYQLIDKYPQAMGGIRLVPKAWKGIDLKIHPDCPVQDEEYDVFYVDEDEFTDDVYADYAQRSRTEWFWVVDREYAINGKLLYVPAEHEQDYIHIFKIPGQLDYRYPEDVTDAWDTRSGGVRLVNKNYDFTKNKFHTDVVPVRYDIFFTDNIRDYTTYSRKSRTKMFWLIDNEYAISNIIKFVPAPDEQKYLLNFKIGGQLDHKYPEQEGGVQLVPRTISDKTPVKYKGNLFVRVREYPVLYVEDVTDLTQVTEDCWLIDRDYSINHDIDWAPNDFERTAIHTFHVDGQLEHKYPEEMGGVRWVPKNWKGGYVIHKDLPVKPKTYKIYYVDDPNDYTQAKGECWLVDKEYQIDEDIIWIPSAFERSFIHTFHVGSQLNHRYPAEMGGVRWVPNNWEEAEIKIHQDSPFQRPEFERFDDEETGRAETTKDWFWVIDPDVDVLPGFDFGYIPDTWDEGKAHVWQKLNPVTGRQFDYAGVKLCPKVPKGKGRPKYIRDPACTQKPYDVFYMDPEYAVIDQLESFDKQANSKMFWAIDPYTRLAEEFKFDYYPSQWDESNVHVFLSENDRGDHKNVRLYPKGTFTGEHGHTEKTVHNNTFENLKLMNTVASLPPRWPDVTLVDMSRDELVHHITTYREQDVPFIWTIDVDVDAAHTVFERGFLPSTQNLNKIHMWQRVSPHTGLVHSYGGVRLWPTSIDTDLITTDTVLMNKIKGIQYVREPGCYYKPYDVVLLTYHDADAEQKYQKLKEHVPHAKWVKDVDGIFEAHQAAAEVAQTKMFWVVDADAQIHEDFKFHYIPDQYDQETVHVWNSVNPITGDVYGYGGVKLFNRQQVLDATSWGLDFTTGLSKRFKVIDEVSCITAFNTDAFSAWRSAFRETVKLAGKRDKDSKARLERWLSPQNLEADFVQEAIRGAQQGSEYGEKYSQKPMRLAKINDYEWLRSQYDNS